MKTNVTLKRHSIQGVEVLQRTSDGYFNITELTKAFNAYYGTNKRIDKFFDNQQTKDFIAEIYNQEVLTNGPSKERLHSLTTNEHANERAHSLTTNEPPKEGLHSLTTLEPFKERELNSSLVDANERLLNSSLEPPKTGELNSSLGRSNESVLNKDVLGYSVKLKRGGRGHSDSTWVHPMLFLEYMMFLSPTFKYRALKMVQDNLIQLRNETGDARKTLANAVAKWAYANGAKTQEQISKIVSIVHMHLKDHFGDKDEGDLDVQKRWCKCTDRLCGMFEDSVMFGNKITEDNIRAVIAKF